MDENGRRDDRVLERQNGTLRSADSRQTEGREESDDRRRGAINRPGLTESERRDRWPIG